MMIWPIRGVFNVVSADKRCVHDDLADKRCVHDDLAD